MTSGLHGYAVAESLEISKCIWGLRLPEFSERRFEPIVHHLCSYLGFLCILWNPSDFFLRRHLCKSHVLSTREVVFLGVA